MRLDRVGRSTQHIPRSVTEDRKVCRSVAVVVCRYRDIAGLAEVRDTESTAGFKRVPRSVPEHHRVGPAVVIHVGRGYTVCRDTELEDRELAVRRLDIPRSVRRSEDYEVCLSIAVVVAGQRYITGLATRIVVFIDRRRALEVPLARRRTIYSVVSTAVTIVVSRDDLIASLAERTLPHSITRVARQP